MTLKTDTEIICLPMPEIFSSCFTYLMAVALWQFLVFAIFSTQSLSISRGFPGFSANPTPLTDSDLPQSQLTKYISEIQQQQVQHADAVSYWAARRASCESLADLALDLLAATASQAYIERVFSACGMLSNGRRKRMSISLEMRVRLKLNAKALA